MIKGPNIKIFKYPRKQIQSSEEINNKKANKDEIAEEKQQKYSTVPLDLIKKDQININHDIDFERREQMSDKGDAINGFILQKNDKQTSKNNNYVKLNQKGISFDKKLIKLSMPDQYQKLRPINKIENKLLSCLQKKKALIPMKKLVKADLLNDVLNKKQRKILTKRIRFTDQLELEAHSLRKKSDSYSKSSEKKQLENVNKLAKQELNKANIKYFPAQVYQKQKEEDFNMRQNKKPEVAYEPTHINAFSFLNNQDSLFQNFENPFPSEINFHQKNIPKQMGFFSSQMRKKQLFKDFENEKQGEIQRGLFINNKNLCFQGPFQERYKQKKQGINIANIKVPKIFPERIFAENNERNSKKYNIFSIQQENSLFLSPQKLQKSLHKGEKRKLNKQIQGNSPWESFRSESSSQYSSYY